MSAPKIHASIAVAGERHRLMMIHNFGPRARRLLFVLRYPGPLADDEHQMRRCSEIAYHAGFDAAGIVTLFSLRASADAGIAFDPEPVIAQYDAVIENAAERANGVVVAWGPCGRLPVNTIVERENAVMSAILKFHRFARCLGMTRMGFPLRPEYVPRRRELKVFPWGAR